MPRTTSLALAAALLCLAAAGAALAGERPQVRLVPADQALAKAAVLHRADLGNAAWRGGATKPDLSGDTDCARFAPKQADLVVTGAAASTFTTTGLGVQSEVHVLETARMVRLDWRRSVATPSLLACLRSGPDDNTGAQRLTVVSARRLPFPRIGQMTAAFRAVVDMSSRGSSKVRLVADFVAIGVGRSEVTLMTMAPYAARARLLPGEQRLARLLALRAAAT